MDVNVKVKTISLSNKCKTPASVLEQLTCKWAAQTVSISAAIIDFSSAITLLLYSYYCYYYILLHPTYYYILLPTTT